MFFKVAEKDFPLPAILPALFQADVRSKWKVSAAPPGADFPVWSKVATELVSRDVVAAAPPTRKVGS